jgi:CHAD domain-containing protein
MPEREVKLGARPGFRLPHLDGVAEGVSAVPGEAERLRAEYLDTQDLRLARWGASLRHRPPEGWTVKLPTEGSGSILRRDERSFPGSPRRPPADAMDLLTAYLRGSPVAPVAVIRTVRRSVQLVDGGGKPSAVVSDDEVSVMDGRRVASRFRELEVELEPDLDDDAGAALLEPVVDRLRAAGAGAPSPTTKLVRALGPAAEAPPDVRLPTPEPSGPAGEVIRHSLAASTLRLLRHDPGVRIGEDDEDVHQARVATRRLRSDLRTFGPLLDPAWGDPLRDELRWIADLLGDVRDADVLLARLLDRAEDLPGEDRSAAARLIGRLRDRHAGLRDRLLAGMRSERYTSLLDRLVEAARDPALLPEADAPASEALPPLVARAWRKLRRDVRGLGDPPDDQALHRVRIRAKRARYAAEAVASGVGAGPDELADALSRLQDELGELQDAVVAEAWLREAAGRTGPRTSFVAGLLGGAEREAARRARAAWPRAWRRASKGKLRAWL